MEGDRRTTDVIEPTTTNFVEDSIMKKSGPDPCKSASPLQMLMSKQEPSKKMNNVYYAINMLGTTEKPAK